MSLAAAWLLSVALSGAASAAAPEAADADRVLVLDLQASGAPADLARNLSEVVVEATRHARPRGSVLGQSEINSMLALEKERDLAGCSSDVTCLAEIGGALGATRLIVGSIGKVGTLYLLNLKLLDAEHARTLEHVSAEVGAEPERLVEATRQWTARLWDPEAVAGVGVVDVDGTGVVAIDGVRHGEAPVRHVVLAPGSHRVEWLHGDPATVGASRTIHVEAYATASVDEGTGVAVVTPPPRVDVARLTFRVGYAYAVPGMHGRGVSYGFRTSYDDTSGSTPSVDLGRDERKGNTGSFSLDGANGVDFEAAYTLRDEHNLVLAVTWAQGGMSVDSITVYSGNQGESYDAHVDGHDLATVQVLRIGAGYEYVFIPGTRKLRPYLGALVGVQTVTVTRSLADDETAYARGVVAAAGHAVAPGFRIVDVEPSAERTQLLVDLTLGFRSELSKHFLLAAGMRLGIGPWVGGGGLPYVAPFVSLGGYL